MPQEGTESQIPMSNSAEEVAPSPGARLRAARERKKMTLDDVAERLHLGRKQIVALESDDYSYVPALIYARGHLRLYAQLVELPPNEILKSFDALGLQPKETPASPIPAAIKAVKTKPVNTEESYSFLTRWWSYAAAFVLLVLIIVWWVHHREEVREETANVSSNQDVIPVATPDGTSTIPLTIPQLQNPPIVNPSQQETQSSLNAEPPPSEDHNQE